MTLRENDLTPAVYNALRAAVGWTPHNPGRAAAALARGFYAVTAWEGDTPVGMARLVGDGLYLLLVDVVVIPAWQGRGVGRALVGRAIDHARRALPAGARSTVLLASAAGKEGFYARFGFHPLPSPTCGPGMELRLGEEADR